MWFWFQQLFEEQKALSSAMDLKFVWRGLTEVSINYSRLVIKWGRLFFRTDVILMKLSLNLSVVQNYRRSYEIALHSQGDSREKFYALVWVGNDSINRGQYELNYRDVVQRRDIHRLHCIGFFNYKKKIYRREGFLMWRLEGVSIQNPSYMP